MKAGDTRISRAAWPWPFRYPLRPMRVLTLAVALGAVLTPVGGSSAPAPAPAAPEADLPTLRALEAEGLRAVEAPPATAAPPFLLRGGTVLTAEGQRLSPGYVLVDGGRIREVGAGPGPDRQGVTVVDITGQFVTPGLIDTHSHIGVYPAPSARAHGDGNEATAPTTPGVWAEHSLWPQDPQLQRALEGGVTTMQVLPGSANLIGGRGVTVHLVPTRGSRAMRFPSAPETVKMACGENPKRVYGEKGGAPSTRMGNLRGQREAFLAARRYLDSWRLWEEKKARAEAAPASKKKGDPKEPFSEPPPERRLDLETLALILRGEALPQVHCYRADDMLSFLQVADEFGFQVRSFHHALEAYKIADILAAKKVSVSTWADWWGFKLEAWDGIPQNLALVEVAGGRPIVHSDSPTGIRRLNQEAAKGLAAARRAGLQVSEDQALRWVTANPAWALGIDAEVGTIQVGKRADLVVWTHDPLSVYAQARLVFVDGALRHDVAYESPRPWSDFEIGTEITP